MDLDNVSDLINIQKLLVIGSLIERAYAHADVECLSIQKENLLIIISIPSS